jgi:hypothetical protein
MTGVSINLLLHVIKIFIIRWTEVSFQVFAKDEICIIGQISHSCQANGWAVPVVKSPAKYIKLHNKSYDRFQRRAYGEVELATDKKKFLESKF